VNAPLRPYPRAVARGRSPRSRRLHPRDWPDGYGMPKDIRMVSPCDDGPKHTGSEDGDAKGLASFSYNPLTIALTIALTSIRPPSIVAFTLL
jgi:hypothetical protein